MKGFSKTLRRGVLPLFLALAAALPQSLMACTPETPTHNCYLFSAFPRNLMWDNFEQKTDDFWSKYLANGDGKVSFLYNSSDILDAAKKKGDTEMVNYIKLLKTYIEDYQIFTGWEYPTREQLVQRNLHLRQMVAAANSYRGKRLRQQYALMKMRGLFGMKLYKQAAGYWQSKARKLSESVYRERMENIYAGCLLRQGQKREAVEIYARQQDYVSLKYCVRNYRNLAGIKKVYADNPNSATLTYLVQDFVNNTQETMDVLSDRYASTEASAADSDLVAGMSMIDARVVYRKDADEFVDFARKVLSEGKTLSPCLWMSAIGCIHHLTGNYTEAAKELSAALSLNGTQRMKDNARAILMVNQVHTEPFGKDFYTLMADNMKWLDRMSESEDKTPDYSPDHYADVKDRLIYRNLVPLLQSKGQSDLARALIGVQCKDMFDKEHWISPYSNDYFSALQELSAKEIAAYYTTILQSRSNALETYAYNAVTINSDYYNDLIGTRYLSQGDFDKAMVYLGRVSLGFLAKQNIAPYAARRTWTVDRWLEKQKMPENFWEESASGSLRFSSNKKLDYCREMVRELSLYRNMREGIDRRQQAYKLASLYYQASYEGDCWWLTQYGVSCSQDSTLLGTKDFVAEAIALLEPLSKPYDFGLLMAQARNKKEAKALRKDFEARYGKKGSDKFAKEVYLLREKSLYALAFIHRDPWYFTGWDTKAEQWYDYDNLLVRPASRQYRALAALSAFRTDHHSDIAPYISHCDVLKRFESFKH